MLSELELVPHQASLAKPLFPTDQAYQEFREAFMAEAIPALDRLRDARRQSEHESRQRPVNSVSIPAVARRVISFSNTDRRPVPAFTEIPCFTGK